jgi:hypothetical protein
VSSGIGDPGGVSYGTHQLSSAKGTMAKYLASPEGRKYAPAFAGLIPGSQQFSAVYRKVAAEDKEGFTKSQKDFITRTHYDPVAAHAKSLGYNTNDPRIQEVLYSMGVQHGRAKQVVSSAGAGTGKSVEEQVRALYAARTNYVIGLGLSGEVRRYQREQRDVLAMGDPTSRTAEPGAPAGGAIAAGSNITTLAKELQGSGIRVSEHPEFGGVNPVHKGRAHYEGRAIDVNAGFGVVEANHPEWGPKFDQIASKARAQGYTVIWRSAGHYNHMHVESKAPGQSPSEDLTTGEPVAIAADGKGRSSPQIKAGQMLSRTSQEMVSEESIATAMAGPIVIINDNIRNNTRTVFQSASYSSRKVQQNFDPINVLASMARGSFF